MAGFREVTFSLLEGFAQNCQIFLYTLLVALPLGLIITFGSMAKFKPIKYLTTAFVWVIRGTPLMLSVAESKVFQRGNTRRDKFWE